MLSVMAAGLLALGACNSGAPHKDKVENILITDAPTAAESTDASSANAPTSATNSATSIATPRPTEPVKHLQALGTEPFWSIEVLPGELHYSSPENLAGTTFGSAETKDGKATRYTGRLEGKSVVLRVEPGTCSDGMSDTVYPYKATFTWGERTEQGCARLK